MSLRAATQPETMPHPLSRREFVAGATGFVACGISLGHAQTAEPSRAIAAPAPVVALERARVLEDARAALEAPLLTLDKLPPPQHTPAGEFFSEPIDETGRTKPYRAHADALRSFSNNLAALLAAFLLTADERYAARAAVHLRAWMVTPSTRMGPQPAFAGCTPGTMIATRANTLDLVPLAEAARAFAFVADSPALLDEDKATIEAWFGTLLTWLNEDANARLARDTKDRRASAWLLLASALARCTRDERQLDLCRLRSKKPTVRNQIAEDGRFPAEIVTPNPYRNTLFNFDLLAGCCELLSSPFDDLWNFDLPDGPGMRAAAAFLFPLIQDRSRWPYPADVEHFRELPGRRPALLFAGHAYRRPEYTELYASQTGKPPAALAYSFPITQPLLWMARAPHGR